MYWGCALEKYAVLLLYDGAKYKLFPKLRLFHCGVMPCADHILGGLPYSVPLDTTKPPYSTIHIEPSGDKSFINCGNRAMKTKNYEDCCIHLIDACFKQFKIVSTQKPNRGS